jgi:hypothetical protein
VGAFVFFAKEESKELEEEIGALVSFIVNKLLSSSEEDDDDDDDDEEFVVELKKFATKL